MINVILETMCKCRREITLKKMCEYIVIPISRIDESKERLIFLERKFRYFGESEPDFRGKRVYIYREV